MSARLRVPRALSLVVLAIVAMSTLVLAACSSEDDATPAPTTPTSEAATVSATGAGASASATEATSTPEPRDITFMAGFRAQANLPFVAVYVADAEAASYQVFLGVGTFNTDARDSCWTWTPAQAAGMDGEETLWTGEFNVPTEPRTYSYIYRVSADDGRTWAYCDMLGDDGSCMENTGGGQNDYVPTQAGAFYVQ